ncbi:MAG: amidohydrolase family protein [Candidatus Bruticola sp.]
MAEIERLPLVFDHHSHLSLAALLSSCPCASRCTSEAELLRYLDKLPFTMNRLQLVSGLNSEIFSLSLAALRQLPPIIFLNSCLHGYICTNRATEILRKVGLDPAPTSARQAEREMSKILTFFSTAHTTSLEATELQKGCQKCIQQMQAAGLYGSEDMMYILPFGPDAALTSSFDLKVRRLFQDDCQSFEPCLPPLTSAAQVQIPRLKLFADGALGARTAALSGSGPPTWNPVLVYTDSELEKALIKCIDIGADTAIHAIGDLAIAQVLRVFSRCLPLPSGSRFKLRLEHCQFITLQQAERCKQLSITLSMQPNFNADSVYYRSVLPKEKLQRNNPLRMLINRVKFVPGQDLLFGSDNMPTGLAVALENSLFPAYPEQALTLEELLAGYSADESKGFKEYIIDRKHQKVCLKS